jgi:hypothetical protein
MNDHSLLNIVYVYMYISRRTHFLHLLYLIYIQQINKMYIHVAITYAVNANTI